MSSDYAAWFERFVGRPPRAWQRVLGEDPVARSRVIRIPTGYGKTLGVLGAWLYHRVERGSPEWPRRLVWALPMRTLVEQTADVARSLLDQRAARWSGHGAHAGKVGVHLLMGGSEGDGAWNLHPEANAIFVGTQDMLLSRALNRGFAAPRARWPMEFGLLNHDVLWVLDEVQLMDVGLATTAQLQAFFDDDAALGRRPRSSWWMSATLQTAWLHSVDTAPRDGAWCAGAITLDPDASSSGLASVPKSLALHEIPTSRTKDFAKAVAEAHRALEDGEFGRVTLAICNTVERASDLYTELQKGRAAAELELVHSQFRPAERAAWKTRFLDRAACTRGADRIIVATQVIEAGVDISAGCVVTELAPWSSLVQRFGRCARYGGTGRVVVVDRGRDEKTALPYEPDRLESAMTALGRIAETSNDVGIASLEAFEPALDAGARAALYPYTPSHLLIRRELDELFDTTSDLTGADVDVSRFIRDGDERDLSVFWLDVPAGSAHEPAAPPARYRPAREELCNIPFLVAQDWLCGSHRTRLRPGVRAWIWDWIDGAWRRVERDALTPGKVICVAADVGGYRVERGFDPSATAAVPPVVPSTRTGRDPQAADELEDSEELSDTPAEAAAPYRTIATHNREVGEHVRRLGDALGLAPRLTDLLVLAGRWHDIGKAHPAFQNIIRSSAAAPRPARSDLAKAPSGAWQRPPRYPATLPDGDPRHGFRHELASCLALFAVLARYAPTHPALTGPWTALFDTLDEPRLDVLEPPSSLAAEPRAADRAVADVIAPASALERDLVRCTADEFDLVAYLVLCHHGKVRVSLHAGPKDQDYRARDDRGLPIRGVREADRLPSIVLEGQERLPELTLTLSPASLGLSPKTGRSWRERTHALQRRYGPAQLAWLEALLIAADRRASQLTTPDPLLAPAQEVAR